MIGAGVTAYGASQVDGLRASGVLAYVAMLPVAVSIVYGFFLAVTSLAFRLVDLRDLLFRLFQGASYSGRWPLGIYPSWLRIALTVIVPDRARGDDSVECPRRAAVVGRLRSVGGCRRGGAGGEPVGVPTPHPGVLRRIVLIGCGNIARRTVIMVGLWT